MATSVTTPNNKINRILTRVILVAFALLAGLVAYWSMDRKPPFELKSYISSAGVPGQIIVIDAIVKRDLDRNCSVTFSRAFFDSRGARTELTDGAMLMNARALFEMNKLNPGQLRLPVKIPVGATSGEGTVMTILDYVCNPTHLIKPIPLVLTMKVLVQ